MGYFTEGFLFSQMCVLANERRKPDETALELLDNIWNRIKDEVPDYEFNDETMPDHPFGQLLKEAFAPEWEPDENHEDYLDDWYDKVEQKLYERYKCS